MGSMTIKPVFDTRKLELTNKLKSVQTENYIDKIILSAETGNQFANYAISINFVDGSKNPIGIPYVFTSDYGGQTISDCFLPTGITENQSVYYQIIATKENSTNAAITDVWKSEIGHLYFKDVLSDGTGDISSDAMYSQWIDVIIDAQDLTNEMLTITDGFAVYEEFNPATEYSMYERVYYNGSTYEYTNATASSGHYPLNYASNDWWQLQALGSYINNIATTTVLPNVNPSVSRGSNQNLVDLNFSIPRAPTVGLNATSVITLNPAQSPTITNTGANGDNVYTFGLPRAVNFSIGNVVSTNAGTSASVTLDTNAAGDKSINFAIPRGYGITNITDNGNGTIKLWYGDGSSFNTPQFTNGGFGFITGGTGTSLRGVLIGNDAGNVAVAPNTVLLTNIASKSLNNYADDSGSANSYVVSIPNLTAYTAGLIVSFKAANANTGASTINCSGLGVKTIYKNVSDNLGQGDISAGQVITVVYDGTNFQVVSGSGGASGGSGIFIPYSNRTTISGGATNVASIGIAQFDKTRDMMTLYQNSTYISENNEYEITNNSHITKLSGTWSDGTVLDFNVLSLSNPETNPVVTTRVDSSFTAIADGTNSCSFEYIYYRPTLDSVFVYYQNLLLFQGTDYTIDEDNMGITLTSFTINTGETINYTFLKNVIENVNAMGLENLSDVSITNAAEGQILKYSEALSQWENVVAKDAQMLGTATTKVFSYNAQTVNENITILGTYNASAVGPITVADGYSVTVMDGGRLVII